VKEQVPGRCRVGAVGEGMSQNYSRGREASHAGQIRGIAVRVAACAGLIALAMGFNASVARAQATYGSDNGSAASGFAKLFGFGKSSSNDINYSERSPLVVPPTRDLPPPEAGPPSAADWPRDTNQQKRSKAKPAPPPENGPPVVDTPNPTYEKKVWYNPKTWFSKEEYGPFTGEPPRADLTDPPVGYRTPSPAQPYGIGPDKKPAKKVAGDGTPVQTSTQAPQPAAAPAPTQAPAPAEPAAAPATAPAGK